MKHQSKLRLTQLICIAVGTLVYAAVSHAYEKTEGRTVSDSEKAASVLFDMGHDYRQRGENSLAVEVYRSGLKLDPDNQRARYFLGEALEALGGHDQEALLEYKTAQALNPNSDLGGAAFARIFHLLVMMLVTHMGNPDLAIADFTEAIRLNPQDADPYNNRGMVWGTKGDYDRVIADYDEAIRLNPQYANAYHNRGSAWENKGEYERAIADYDEAIRLNPQDDQAYQSRGFAWATQGDYDRAIRDFDAAIRLKPDKALAYRNRGLTRFAQGQIESAEADFFAALRRDPSDVYSVIWRYLAQSRADHRAAAASELAPNAEKIDKAKWPAPIIDLLAGTTDVDALLEMVTTSDQTARREQMCEATFYVGEWQLLQGRQPEALVSLERAEHDCPKYFIEYFSASAELKRLSH